jgi:hypothetical protein
MKRLRINVKQLLLLSLLAAVALTTQRLQREGLAVARTSAYDGFPDYWDGFPEFCWAMGAMAVLLSLTAALPALWVWAGRSSKEKPREQIR